MSAIRRITSLRLQATHEGDVWFSVDGGPPELAIQGVDAIRKGEWFWGRPAADLKIRELAVPALPVNADIIMALDAHLRAGRVAQAYLTPPPSASCPLGLLDFPSSMLPLAEAQKQISSVLRKAYAHKPSLGGKRPPNWADALTYRLCQLFAHGRRPEWSEVSPIACAHPAWPALSFVPGFDPLAGARLLSLIVDPRWYIDPNKPDASKKLASAFGLGREGYINMLAHSKNSRIASGRNSDAAIAVLATWYSVAGDSEAQHPVLSRSFPWRVYYEAKEPAEGLKRASRVLLKTICSVWLDHLTPPRIYDSVASVVATAGAAAGLPGIRLRPGNQYSPQLFVPEYYFNGEELARWQQHIGEWRGKHWSLASV